VRGSSEKETETEAMAPVTMPERPVMDPTTPGPWVAEISIQYYSVVENERELRSGSKVIVRE
jgi:hypothetical protein